MDAKPGMDGGWAHGPAEAWAFALRLSRGSDREKRMAMLMVDNATEIALRTYLGLNVKQRGGPKVELSHQGGFPPLLDGLEQCFPDLPEGIGRADLLWFHDVRNTLHHRGNGLSPDTLILRKYLTATETLLRLLFGDSAVNAAVRDLDLAQEEGELPSPAPLPVPRPVQEVDGMIKRIRLLASSRPAGAPMRLALPADLDELTQRVWDLIGEEGMEWD